MAMTRKNMEGDRMTTIVSRFMIVFLFVATIAVALPAPAAQASPITGDEALSIGIETYLYFYPLLTMDITRRQFTNVEPGKGLGGPMNTFVNMTEYPPADFKGVVRPNFDTLYSSAWLDLTREPVIVSAPDTGGRYYLLPMLDMWSDVFASPGTRTTGTKGADFLVTPPRWTGTVPAGVTHIPAPTPYVWIIGRTKTDGPADYRTVHKIQEGYRITPLSQRGKSPSPLLLPPTDRTVDMKTPPKIQVDTMAAAHYFAYAAELLKVNPPHITDQPIIALMKRIGIEPGKSFNMAAVDPKVRAALDTVPAAAQELMKWKLPTLARIVNGWSMNTDTMGVYGNYYLKRAIFSQIGLGANVPEDAVYPMSLSDNRGKPFNGKNRYVLHFDKNGLPPVNAFWSITLYDDDGFPVSNILNRFAISSWMPTRYNPDGSLDIFIQNGRPGKDGEANWLPAPQGPFNLTMRLYAPKSEVLTGKWNPPPVQRVE